MFRRNNSRASRTDGHSIKSTISLRPDTSIEELHLTRDTKHLVIYTLTARRAPALQVWTIFPHKHVSTLQLPPVPINQVAALSPSMLVTASKDCLIRVWHAPSDRCLYQLKVPANPVTLVDLGNARFIVGMQRYNQAVWVCHVKRNHGIQVEAVLELGGRCSKMVRYGDRLIVVVQTDFVGSEKMSVWDLNTYRRVTEIQTNAIIGHVAMNHEFLVLATRQRSSRYPEFWLYDTSTYTFLRKMGGKAISAPVSSLPNIRSVHVVGDEGHILFCFHHPVGRHSSKWKYSTVLLRCHDGKELWRGNESCDFTSNLQVFSDGSFLWPRDEKVYIVSPPQHIREAMTSADFNTQICATLPPLQDALMACISGLMLPFEACRKLITAESCAVSFEEWQCAHKLLIMAIDDGDVKHTSRFQNQDNYWFKTLYLAIVNVPDFDLDNRGDFDTLSRILKLAKECELIDSPQLLIGDLRVAKNIKKEVRTLHQAGALILNRVLLIEDRVERLRKTIEEYRVSYRMSILVGMGLQLIPLVGGVVAGVVAVGIDVFQGLSVEDFTEYALAYGMHASEETIEKFGERVINNADKILSPCSVENMDNASRARLEHAVQYCNCSITEFHGFFSEPNRHKAKAQRRKWFNPNDGRTPVPIARGRHGHRLPHLEPTAPTYTSSSSDGSDTDSLGDGQVTDLQNDFFDKQEGGNGGCREVKSDPRPTGQNANCTLRVVRQQDDGPRRHSTGELLQSDCNVSGLVSKYAGIEMTAQSLGTLPVGELAAAWAAYVANHDDEKVEMFDELRGRLHTVLTEEGLGAAEVVNVREVGRDELFEVVFDALEGNEKIGRVTLGLKAKVKRFINSIDNRA